MWAEPIKGEREKKKGEGRKEGGGVGGQTERVRGGRVCVRVSDYPSTDKRIPHTRVSSERECERERERERSTFNTCT